MKTHYSRHGRSLCQVENNTVHEVALTTVVAGVNCMNCRNLGGLDAVRGQFPAHGSVHLLRDDDSWCGLAGDGEEITRSIGRVDCGSCLAAHRRRLDPPKGARPGRRTG